MAIVQNPITGRTRKKFGSAVFSKQFGKNTLRTKPLEVANPRTEGQVNQRNKFSLMVESGRLLLSFIKTSFKQATVGMSEFNTYMKENIKTAITGSAGNYSIDYSLLVVAKGTLTGLEEPAATSEAGHVVNISWVDNQGQSDALATDKLMYLIVNPAKQKVVYSTGAALRADESQSVTVPAGFIGDSVHVYAAFISETGAKVSDSEYLGELVIVA
ncbi:MAG: DUF6266 family protein [Bacteroidota bacterium]